MPNENLNNKESIQSDDNLKVLIKEIEELKDKNRSNDKIENGIIVNNKLNDGLRWYLEKNKDVALSLINEINSIKTNNLSEEIIQDLQNLVKLLSWIVNWSTEWKELEEGNQELHNLTDIANQSFYKLKKFIEENKDLSSLNQEFQNIINFINDDKNNVKTLSLYIKIASLPEETNKTNKEVLNRISEAIRNHFNIPEWSDIEAVKKIQLDEIFKNIKTKKDLVDIYEKYVWEKWNWNNLSDKSLPKSKLHLNISYSDFISRFNNSLNNVNFNNTVDKDKIGKNMTPERVNNIKNYVNNMMWGEGNEFLKYQGGKLKYDIGKVKKFLWAINENNFYRVSNDGRAAWISAVQLFLNQTMWRNLKVDWEYSKWWETYSSVLRFQKEYNKKHKDKIKEDWIPGPKTLKRFLLINSNDNRWWIEWLDTSDFDQYELEILKVNSEKFYEWYNYTKEEIEAHHHYKRWRIIENIQSYVQKIVSQKRNIWRKEIIEHIRSDLVTLPKKEKADIIQWVHKVVNKFNNIRKYLDFENWPYKNKYPNAKALLCAMRWITDRNIISNITNKITVKQYWVWLTFFVEDQNSYHIIYGCWRPGWQWSWWFNHEFSAIPELEWTLSVVNWKNPGNNINDYRYGTIIHEWQHNRNSYFMPDKEQHKPITMAKDEITAYLRDWGRNIQQIENTLTKPRSQWWLYQYGLEWQNREKHKAQVRTLLKYVKNLMEIVRRNIWVTRDKIISMLSDTPVTQRKNIHDKVMQAVKNGWNLKEFWRTWTAEKRTEINEINLANSINEVKHILNDPKYSHISRMPNNKWWIEISAIIDEVVAKRLPITYIPIEIRQKVQELIRR